jgi:hypothetical protein
LGAEGVVVIFIFYLINAPRWLAEDMPMDIGLVEKLQT